MGYCPLVVLCLPLADLHHFCLTKRLPKTSSVIQPTGTPSTFYIDQIVPGFVVYYLNSNFIMILLVNKSGKSKCRCTYFTPIFNLITYIDGVIHFNLTLELQATFFPNLINAIIFFKFSITILLAWISLLAPCLGILVIL